MAVIGDLVAYLRMDSADFSKKSRDAGKDSGQLGGVLDQLGGNAARMAKQFTAAAVVVGGVKFLGDSAAEARDFTAALQSSTAIQKLSGDQFDALHDKALALASDPTIKGFAGDIAAGYQYLALAGLDVEKQLASISVVGQFAQTDAFDLATATDLLTDSQSALGLASQDTATHLTNMTRVSDSLVKASSIANASTQQFAEALTNDTAAAFRGLGKDVEEALAVLAAFADQGTKGEAAGTKTAIVLRDLQTKALANADGFRAAGIGVFDAAGEMRNMADIVSDLEGRLDGLSDAEKKQTLLALGFSDKSVGALQTLLGTSDKIRQYEADLRSASGTTAEVAGRTLTAIDKLAKELTGSWQELKIRIGEPILDALVPPARLLAEALRDVVDLTVEVGEGLGMVADFINEDIFNDPGLVHFTENMSTLSDVLGKADLLGQLAEFRKAVSGAADPETFLPVEQVEVFREQLARLESRAVSVDVSTDEGSIVGLLADLQGLTERRQSLKLGADSAEIDATIERVREQLREIAPDGRLDVLIAATTDGTESVAEALELDAALTDAEKLGDSLSQHQQDIAEIQKRAVELNQQRAEGLLTEDGYASAWALQSELLDKATGGAIAYSKELERELTLVGATAEQRKLAALEAAGASLGDLQRVEALQAELALRNQSLDLERQLAEARDPGSTDFANLEQLGVDPEQLDHLRNLKQQIEAANRAQSDLQAGAALADSLTTPAERIREQVVEARRLLDAGAVTEDTYARRIAQLRDEWAGVNAETREHKALLNDAVDGYSAQSVSRVLALASQAQQATAESAGPAFPGLPQTPTFEPGPDIQQAPNASPPANHREPPAIRRESDPLADLPPDEADAIRRQVPQPRFDRHPQLFARQPDPEPVLPQRFSLQPEITPAVSRPLVASERPELPRLPRDASAGPSQFSTPPPIDLTPIVETNRQVVAELKRSNGLLTDEITELRVMVAELHEFNQAEPTV